METENKDEIVENSIKALNKDDVHRICSGQVVLNLSMAVKELLENSIDAGATSIEIKLREYGSELIEVIDNGSGVEENNFAGLTLKHHTSKIRSFADVLSISTFGFRGEALSSLCALSDVMIITRHSSSPNASKLEFDYRGQIKKQTSCARQIGTTVILANLFSQLPVRYNEFKKNLKREFTKMCTLLQAYCLVADNLKIQCTNQTKSGARSTVLSTQATKSMRENISCVFGAKQLQNLIEIIQIEPSEEILTEFGFKDNSNMYNPYELLGFISNSSHGSGRSTTDRQFYYINSRPCDLLKVSKLVNEVYRQFNCNQYPFVFLNVKVEQTTVDVNVTPDKRKVFLEHEKLLLAIVKTTLLKLFERTASTYSLQNVSLNKSMESVQENSLSQCSLLDKFRSNSQKSPEVNKPGTKRSLTKSPTKNNIMSFLYEKRMKISDDYKQDLSEHSSDSETETKKLKNGTITDFINGNNSSQNSVKDVKEKYQNVPDDKINNIVKVEEYKVCHIDQKNKDGELEFSACDTTVFSENIVNVEDIQDDLVLKIKDNLHSDESQATTSQLSEESQVTLSQLSEEDLENIKNTSYAYDEKIIRERKTHYIDISFDDIHKAVMEKINFEKSKKEDNITVKFHSEMSPSANVIAEKELQKEISKDMFSKMKIIGQFNLGFIITQLGNDLFIVDQHASDEKYNFETLQSTETLKNQRLVIPSAMNLTAINESLLIEHLDIFKKNGFDFEIDEQAENSHKIKLTSIPISKNWVFGKDDIDELLFMLQESPNTMCRPSRVRAMFASRACRKSVMIGQALSHKDMRQLIDHMGEIEQPWNCPHGRPTMRHLINLALILNEDKETNQ